MIKSFIGGYCATNKLFCLNSSLQTNVFIIWFSKLLSIVISICKLWSNKILSLSSLSLSYIHTHFLLPDKSCTFKIIDEMEEKQGFLPVSVPPKAIVLDLDATTVSVKATSTPDWQVAQNVVEVSTGIVGTVFIFANWCNMTFTAGNLFHSHSCIGVTRVKTA